MRRLLFLTLLCCSLCAGHAQTDRERAAIIAQRMSRIDYCHLSLTLKGAVAENYQAEPRLSLGIGTFRNIVCADIHLGYRLTNPLWEGHGDGLATQYVTAGITADVNLVRWNDGAVAMGGTLSWNAATAGTYYHSDGSTTKDAHIAHSHATAGAHIAVRMGSRWVARVGYDYDLAPAFDQKHVSEAPDYDYIFLHDKLFERGRLTAAITYLWGL